MTRLPLPSHYYDYLVPKYLLVAPYVHLWVLNMQLKCVLVTLLDFFNDKTYCLIIAISAECCQFMACLRLSWSLKCTCRHLFGCYATQLINWSSKCPKLSECMRNQLKLPQTPKLCSHKINSDVTQTFHRIFHTYSMH